MASSTGSTVYSGDKITLNGQLNIDISTDSVLNEVVYVEPYYMPGALAGSLCETMFGTKLPRFKITVSV
jgi:hypothetical protein